MNAPFSNLGNQIRRKYKDRIKEIQKNNYSLIGEIFEINGEKYIITDGEINNSNKIEEFENKIKKLRNK